MRFLPWVQARSGPAPRFARPGLERLETRALLSGFASGPHFVLQEHVFLNQGASFEASTGPSSGFWNAPPPMAVNPFDGNSKDPNGPDSDGALAPFAMFHEGAPSAEFLPNFSLSVNAFLPGTGAAPPILLPEAPGTRILATSAAGGPRATPEQGPALSSEDLIRTLTPVSTPPLNTPRSPSLASQVPGVEVALETHPVLPRPGVPTALAGVSEIGTGSEKGSTARTPASREPLAGAGETQIPISDTPAGQPAQADILTPSWFEGEAFLVLRQVFRPDDMPEGNLPATLTHFLLSPAVLSCTVALASLEVWRRWRLRRNLPATEWPQVLGPSGL
jgi:hypothetical protein